MNSRKDLDREEKCATCGNKYPRKEMRGTNNGDWLCIADWEDKHGSAAPPPVPVYTPPRAG
jgi:hypothetical protein